MLPLVITIVVLIILAAVAISLSLGNNGIFNRAKTAKEQYMNLQEYEQVEGLNMANKIDSVVTSAREEDLQTLKDDVVLLQQQIATLTNYRAGTATMPACSKDSSTYVEVTFTNPMSDANYAVTVTPNQTCAWWAQSSYAVTNKTANGFRIYVYDWGGTKPQHVVCWMALPNKN